MKSACKKYSAVLIIMLMVSVFSAYGVSKKPSARGVLAPGRPVTGVIDLSPGGSGYETFRFNVPAETFSVRLAIKNAPADLDIFIKKGSEIRDYEDVDYYSTLEDYNEEIYITRLSEVPLEEGVYYVDISYQRDILPVINGVRADKVPFELVFETEEYASAGNLRPGIPLSSELSPDKGMAAVYSMDIPERTESFRIDVFNTFGDLDIMVSYKDIVITKTRNDFLGESLSGKESLIYRNPEGGYLSPGTYFVMIFDQVSDDHPVGFSVIGSLGDDVPGILKYIPGIPEESDPMRNAFLATAEVIGNAGKGSGCIVSRSGYIITNWHVIKDFSGKSSENITVGINLSIEEPPEELFQASLVDYSEEKDLALLKISSGLYGNPLPYGYTFPYFQLGDSDTLTPGQPLTFLGFPGIGGTGSRASLSLTRGIVSGFERNGDLLLVKTDAEINSGNSGGASINIYHELIGIPTVTIGEDAGQMGYITPVSMIPEEWLNIIKR